MQNLCGTQSYAELMYAELMQNWILCRTYAGFNSTQNLCRIQSYAKKHKQNLCGTARPIKATLEEPHPTSQSQEVDFLVSNRKFINHFESQQYAQPYRMIASATTATTKGSGVKAPRFCRHLQVLHLPHKPSPSRWKCHACHDKRQRRQSATLPQTSTQVLQVLHLPHKSSQRCWKCHDKRQRHQSATLPQTSTQVLQVLHLPHKSSQRCLKCHACHDKRQRRQSATLPQTSMQGLQVLHLPHKSSPWCWKRPACHDKRLHLPQNSSPRCCKCHTCHDKRQRRQSATLPQKVLHLPHNPARNAESATPATTKGGGVKAPHVRRHLHRYCKCYTCHTNPAQDAESATPATTKDTGIKAPRFRRKRYTCHTFPACNAESATPATTKGSGVKAPHSADIYYAGTASATPATQIQPVMLKAPACHDKRLPQI